MLFHTLENYLFETWQTAYNNGVAPDAPPTILGKPGIGKSACSYSVAQRIAKFLGRRVVNLVEEPEFNGNIDDVVLFYAADLSSFLPEDIGGIPKPVETSICGRTMTVASYAIQRWLAPYAHPRAIGVLCFDDIAAATQSVQVAVRQAILDRRVGQNKMGNGVLLFATGNRREDKSGATTLPAHFRNATCMLEIQTDVHSWCDWYGQQPGAEPLIAAYLRWRPSNHAQTPKDAKDLGSFATPRSWYKLGKVWNVAKKNGVHLEVAAGHVGEGVAAELVAFDATRNSLVEPALVLADPVNALPDPRNTLNSPDKSYAMTTALGETAAAWRKGEDKKKAKEAPLAFLRAVGHVTQRDREYIATAVHTYTANGGDIKGLTDAAKANSADPLVKGVIDFLSATFRGKKA